MPNTSFDAVKITAGNFTPVSGTVMDLGCTGSLSGETEVRTVTKICEGAPVAERNIPQFMTLSFSGHLYVEAIQELFGLTANDTVLTQFEYTTSSINKSGSFSWEVENMEGDAVKTIVFPNAVVSTGYVFGYENGLEEIAETEITIKAMPDATGVIYHETIVTTP